MKLYLDCLPCALRQVLEASRMSTESTQLQEKIMDKAIGLLNQYKKYNNSPELVRDMQKIVKDTTKITDPYCKIKKRDIQAAFKLYPMLKQYVKVEDQLYWALKVAATGNVLDSGIYYDYGIENVLEAEVKQAFAVCDIDLFNKKLETAKNILIIGDNAGETVFDRVLIELLWRCRITYAVRGAAVLNDATKEDAYASKLEKCSNIITTGSDVPGVKLEECCNEFLDCFNNADIVISKGQGNYETLSDCDRDIYFLLKAKCPVLSKLIGVKLNDYIFQYYNPDACPDNMT